MPRFVPRQRKHKILQREESARSGSTNSNQIQILPETQTEKEQKKERLRQDLSAGQSKIPSKKQKRLDKYIENKLKKDESLDLLKKLSHDKFDTSRLQSSKNLGKRKRDDFAEDWVPSIEGKSKRLSVQEGNVSDVDSEDSFEHSHSGAFGPTSGNGDGIESVTPVFTVSTGSGLKHPLEFGENGLPLLQTRYKKKKTKLKASQRVEIPWEGFDSEPSDAEEDFEGGSSGQLESDDNSLDEASDAQSSESYESARSEEDEEPGSEDVDDDSDSSGSVSKDIKTPKPRNSGFKAWATEQINKSLGYTPSNVLSELHISQPAPRNGPSQIDSSGAAYTTAMDVSSAPDRKAFTIQVDRSQTIQEARMNLPIVGEEQKIMEAIYNNPIVIIWGATGSGKTTQVPQFLFEAGFGSPESSMSGMIGITQPRRVAAVSMADRVREELGQHGHKVSYQIRFESTISRHTAIKFMTDGILLRELSQDLLLRKYSVIVIDEAHERSINTDILIGMLSRIVPRRAEMSRKNSEIKPLKLVIMSATLRTSDFLNEKLFKDSRPPVVQAEGRQYPVVNHFSRTTQRDYVEETVRKIIRGHRKLPPGGMLVFLTGQNEIRSVMGRLETALSRDRPTAHASRVQFSATETPLEADDFDLGGFDQADDAAALSDIDITTSDNEEDDEFDIGELPDPTLQAPPKIPTAVHLLPLYSQLPTKEQLRVFEPVSASSRLIVLATNVAETSLTIPGIRYVFDCGRSKERVYNPTTGVQSFEIGWISKASAEQRKGRAGRTGPGHCYRLYSSAVYERDFPEHADPEVLRTPIESVVLQLKGFHFPGDVANFPFPTPPSTDSIVKAEKLLTNLGALSRTGDITQLGKDLSIYPLSPRLGKMLVTGLQRGGLSQVIALVAGLAVGDVFIAESQLNLTAIGHQQDQVYTQKDHEEDGAREQRKREFGKARALLSRNDKTSDAIKLLTAVCLHSQSTDRFRFCESNFLRSKAMREVEQLRSQLTSIVRANDPATTEALKVGPRVGSSKELKILKEIVGAGFIDQIAIRADLSPSPPEMPRKPKRAIDVPYLPLTPLRASQSAVLEEKAVYIHPSSVLARVSPKDVPQYIIYSHLQQSQSALVGTEKIAKARMFPLTAIEGAQLVELARDTPLLRYGKPVGQVNALGGVPKKQEAWIVPELGGGNGLIGWPLPPRKVVQVQDLKKGWVVEKFLT